MRINETLHRFTSPIEPKYINAKLARDKEIIPLLTLEKENDKYKERLLQLVGTQNKLEFGN